MAGLLYKDFAAVKGRWYVTGALLSMFFMLVFRLILPAGETADIILWALSLFIIVILIFLIIDKVEVGVVSADEGSRQKHYFLSLPISQKQYVASKYLFMLSAFFAALSFALLLEMMCLIGCEDEMIRKLGPVLESMLPALFCIMLIIPAVELPFYIGFGAKRGNQIKIGLLLAVFFLVIVFLMFGDLTIFDRIDLVHILSYLYEHDNVVLCFNVFIPYGSLLLYYLSYRVSCWLFTKRRWEND